MSDRSILRVALSTVFATTVLFCSPYLEAAQEKLSAAPKRVLFIGNSYTAQVRGTLLQMLANSPYNKSSFEFITKGGATLQQHLNSTNTLQRIAEGNWDFVVLQDQSQTPALPGKFEKSFHRSVDQLTQLIRTAGAEPVLYMTWGRRAGDARNNTLFPDFETMQKKISAAYRAAAKRNDISLAPVGEVWAMVLKKDKALGNELYRQDGSHPSAKGAHLVSSVFFHLLFNDSLYSVWAEGALGRYESNLIKNAVLASIKVSENK